MTDSRPGEAPSLSDQVESLLPTLALQLPAGRAHSARGKSDRSATWTGGAAAAAGGQQTGIRVRGSTHSRGLLQVTQILLPFFFFPRAPFQRKRRRFLLSPLSPCVGAITLKSEYTQMYGSFNLIHRRDVRVQTPATPSLHERRRKETGGGGPRIPFLSLLSNGPHRKRYVEQSFFLARRDRRLATCGLLERRARPQPPGRRSVLPTAFLFRAIRRLPISTQTAHTAPATRSKKRADERADGLRARTQTHHIHASGH